MFDHIVPAPGERQPMGAILRSRTAFPGWGSFLVLVLCACVLCGAAIFRSVEYDENYSVFVTSGIARPAWPEAAFTREAVPAPFSARTGPTRTMQILRDTDVHPPLYFMSLRLWRDLAGDSLLALRGLSVVFALAAVLAWMVTAWRAGIPPLAVGLTLTLAYGFGYTGHIARGFALAHLLVAIAALAGHEAWLATRAKRPAWAAWAAAAGLAAGLATLTNYLAVFPAAAAMGWLVLAAPGNRRRVLMAVAVGLPFACMLAGDLYFFLAQKDARVEQFEPFRLIAVASRLAQFNAASLFGGLPLYVTGAARSMLSGGMAMLLLAVAVAVAWVWRRLPPTRWLWLLGALAPSLGLVVLGLVFGNSPIELRYVAFAMPFVAVLIAAAAAAWFQAAPRATAAAFAVLLAVEAAGTLGMQLHPATQQPFRQAVAAAKPYLGEGDVLLVPFGNDGVGITGSVLREVPADQPMIVLRSRTVASAPGRAAGFRRAVLLGVGDRDGTEQARAAVSAFRSDAGWCSAGVVWRDSRGDYVEVFDKAPQPPDPESSTRACSDRPTAKAG